MKQQFLSQSDLTAIVAKLVGANVPVFAPVVRATGVEYAAIRQLDDAKFDAQPLRSLKEFFLPTTEIVLHYKRTHEGVEIQEISTKFNPRVVLGALPCDAAGVDVLDKVMGWDYRDELWFGRREATTIVSMMCRAMDANCFCTATGLGPDSTRGADVLLTKVEGGYLAEAFSAKGETFLANTPGATASEKVVSEAASAKQAARGRVQTSLPNLREALPEWLSKNFTNDIWKTAALRCHGCGLCASVCPTCHCFDIVDEHENASEGVRRRNWDSCQTAKFTVHSSGHNPRQSQMERYRQRIMHKFSVYPTRFDDLLCSGCGRCSRLCPGGQNLPELLGTLAASAKGKSE